MTRSEQEATTWKKAKQDCSTRPEQECPTKPTKEELDTAFTQISKLLSDVQTNIQVKTVIAQYWANFPAALEKRKIAVQENWRCNSNRSAGQGAERRRTIRGCQSALCVFRLEGIADEATKRQLMQYSRSQEGDIMVHLVGGESWLWSQLRDHSWSEVERIAGGETL